MTNGYDLVVRGGDIVTASERFTADIGVRGERIAAIGLGLRGEREIDATGRIVIPGGIDGHAHMQTPTAAAVYDDTFETGSIAAAFGGVTTFLDQVQVRPGRRLVEGIDERLADAAGRSIIDYGFHVNVREASRERVAEIPEVAARGFRRFKFFMYYDGYRLPDDIIFQAMQQVSSFGGLSIVHAENDAVITELLRQNAEAGRVGGLWNARSKPPVMEGEAVYRALAMASVAGSDVLVFHVAAAEAVRELRHAKRRGQRAYGEAVLHYLFLDEDDLTYDHGDITLDVSPPLRDAATRDALWRGLGRGDLDIVSSDHGPRRRRPGPDGGLIAPTGTTGLEQRLGLTYTHGVLTGRMSIHRWVDACSTRPALIHGLRRKGRLLPGFDADIVVFDPNRRFTISPETMHSDVDHTTYDGYEAHGWAETTISRGEVIVDRGQLVATPGRGRLVDVP